MAKTNLVDILKDSNGKLSSKRIGGIALFFQGSLMKWILFIVGLFVKLPNDVDKLDNIASGLLWAGVGVLGWGIVEGKKLIINNKDAN